MANIKQIQIGSNTYDIRDTTKIYYGDVIQPTNPFGGKQLYINSVDNAFASADKKYYITITKHSVSSGGVTYPYINSSKASTDDNYFVDGPVTADLSSSAHNIFDGSYETGLNVSETEYLKVRIMFGTNTSPSATTSYFSGYPYGNYYLSYYYVGGPGKVSQYRVYNKYSGHGVGWKLINATAYNGSLHSGGYIEQINDSGNYQRSCIEFIIYGSAITSGYTTCLTEIDYKLERPDLSENGATLTKYGPQKLYFPFTWNSNRTDTITINPSGNISAISFTENGTPLVNKYAGKGISTGGSSAANTGSDGSHTHTTTVKELTMSVSSNCLCLSLADSTKTSTSNGSHTHTITHTHTQN